jgi:dihydrofolate reductase
VRLTATTFLTLDGVVQSPGAPEEDASGGFARGGWLVPYADDDMGEIVSGWFAQADAFLLGRKTYEIFAGHWPTVPDGNPVAASLNSRPKYVVSATLDSLTWHNSTLIRGEVLAEVGRLKAQPGRELQVHGSGHLVQTLMAGNLIDEYRLWLYPVVVGGGRRLFDVPGLGAAFRLTDTKITSTGVVVLTYYPAGDVRQGSFATSAEPDQHRILR